VTDAETAGGVQVISRAAQLLRALEDEPLGLSLAQLSERVHLPRSTVHRIVTALSAEGFLVSASASGRVRIGPEFARLASAGAAELWRSVESYMQWLADELGETVDCALLEGNQVRVIHVIPTTRYTLRAVAEVGQSFPLYCSAKGKALLAAYDPQTALRMLPATLDSYTPYTLTDIDDVAADLERVRQTGISHTREETTLGVCAAAIAVHEPSGMLVALSVVVPAQRYHNLEPRMDRALQQVRLDAMRAFAVPEEPASLRRRGGEDFCERREFPAEVGAHRTIEHSAGARSHELLQPAAHLLGVSSSGSPGDERPGDERAFHLGHRDQMALVQLKMPPADGSLGDRGIESGLLVTAALTEVQLERRVRTGRVQRAWRTRILVRGKHGAVVQHLRAMHRRLVLPGMRWVGHHAAAEAGCRFVPARAVRRDGQRHRDRQCHSGRGAVLEPDGRAIPLDLLAGEQGSEGFHVSLDLGPWRRPLA
jgi:DNA-binding IclR family transcriptional regulator